MIQMIVMEVLKQVMKAAQEDLAARKKLKLKGNASSEIIFDNFDEFLHRICLYI